MRRIYKYPLTLTHQNIELPIIRTPLSVGFKDNTLYLWTIVDTEPELETSIMTILVVPTGREVIFADAIFIGTAIHRPSGEVYHVFRTPNENETD